MSCFRLFCLLILLISCGSKEESSSKNTKTSLTEKKPVFLFVGDSLTAGHGIDINDCFVSLLQKEFDSLQVPLQTRNAGISGETSSGTLERIDWLIDSKPNIIFLCTGSNDGLRGIRPELYRQNLERIIVKIQKSNIKLILAGIRLPINFGMDYIKAMATVPKELAEKYNLLFYPFLLEGVAADNDLNQADFIHPNEKGHKVIFKNLNAFFRKNELY